MRSDWRKRCGKSDNERSGTAESNGTASDIRASRANFLRKISSRFSVLGSQCGPSAAGHFSFPKVPAPFPTSLREKLSTTLHLLPGFRGLAIRRLLRAWRQIPLSCPLRERLRPSASPFPSRRAENPASCPRCNSRTRDAVARRLHRVPTFRRQLQFAAERALRQEYPPPP